LIMIINTVIWFMVITLSIIYSLSTGDYILPIVFISILLILTLFKKMFSGGLGEAVGEDGFENTG